MTTMEKEALIDIILNDIKEVHALVNTFKGKNEINAAFINLTRTKIANISEELSLLEQLNVEKKTPVATESSLTSAALSASSDNDHSAIAESSSRFAEGESYSAQEAVDTNKADAGTTSKADEEAIDATGQTITSDTQTLASETKALKVDKQTIEPASQAKASDTETLTGYTEVLTDERETLKSDNQTKHQNTQTEHSDTQTKASDQQTNTSAKAATASSNAKKETRPSSKATVLGEVIRKEGASVNEAIASRKEMVEDIKQIGKPVDDVRKAFGLNDRFYFQRELFGNNADLFNQTLDQINHMESYDSAISFLQSNYTWEADNEATESFYKSIKRRFI